MSVCEYKDLANVFKHIKDIKGVKAFAEGSQVANIMTDLVPEMVVEISIINNLSQAGILSEFAQTSCSDRDGQKRTAFKAKNYLTVNIGTREDLIERCVSALAEAFGWNETPDETNLGVSDDLKFGGNTGAAIGTGNDGNSGKTETGGRKSGGETPAPGKPGTKGRSEIFPGEPSGIYPHGYEVTQTRSEIDKLLEQFGSKEEYIEFCHYKAKSYEDGEDGAEAIKWYQKMIDVGCADGYRSIADIYVNGIGNVKASFEEAYKWYQKGIIAGDIKSYKGIADIYKNGKCGARKDYFKAAEWYEKGANAGDTDCYYELGCIYEEGGNDLKKDVDKAIYWLDRAYEFDNENFDAAIDLAILYAKKGGDKNEAESKKYLNKLQSFLEKIGESHWTLYLPLARIYELLTKNDENRQAALKCYCKAISAGNASAICEACRLYFVEGGLKLEGITEEKLFNKLYNYVMKEKSDEAYYLIGYCYKNGLGTKKNRFQAKAYLKKAADKGHRQAAKELESFLF